MGETKYINSKSFTATNTVRSAATITVLVFCLSAACGENLTTLDGRTFTNVYSVTNYPSVVVIRHEGGTAGVKASNLPEDFRKKYGVVIVTNSPKTFVPPKIQVDPTDLFLSQNLSSKLEVEKTINDVDTTNDASHAWVIRVASKGFELTGYEWRWVTEHGSREHKNTHWANSKFKFGQEAVIAQTYDKFLEWEGIALTNNTEAFEKIISKFRDTDDLNFYPETIRTFTFIWGKDYGVGQDARSMLTDSMGTPDSKSDIVHFRELLKSIPALKEELVQKIRSGESQKDLFK